MMNFSLPFKDQEKWYNFDKFNNGSSTIIHNYSQQQQNRDILYKRVSKSRMKRRGVSPKIFPYKIRVTEEKVVQDLLHLQISPSKLKRRQRTFSEIEKSLVTDSDTEDETEPKILISDEFMSEINNFRQSFLRGNPGIAASQMLKQEDCKAVVLWSPPPFTLESQSETADVPVSTQDDSAAISLLDHTAVSTSKITSTTWPTYTTSIMTPTSPSYDMQYDDEMEL